MKYTLMLPDGTPLPVGPGTNNALEMKFDFVETWESPVYRTWAPTGGGTVAWRIGKDGAWRWSAVNVFNSKDGVIAPDYIDRVYVGKPGEPLVITSDSWGELS